MSDKKGPKGKSKRGKGPTTSSVTNSPIRPPGGVLEGHGSSVSEEYPVPTPTVSRTSVDVSSTDKDPVPELKSSDDNEALNVSRTSQPVPIDKAADPENTSAGKLPKIFEAPLDPQQSSQPRPSGAPPYIVQIEPNSSGIQSEDTDYVIIEDGDSKPDLNRRRTSSLSPGGFSLPPIAEIKKVGKGFTGRQWITLIIFGVGDLISGIVVSIQAPFYPMEAESKGATASEYGLVFGVYELIAFLCSPIFGKYMNRLGPRWVFNFGMYLTAISCICFGLLDRLNDHTLFISLSFLLRITESIGASAFVTSSFAMIAMEFPDSVATTFASLETFFGIGLIVGPSLGGALYELGGYILPFAVTGAWLLILGLISSIVMPKFQTISDKDGKRVEGYGIFSILKIPSVFLEALSIAVAACTSVFLNATLEPHLRQFNLSPLQVGLMFVISGGVYAIAAPVIGNLSDRFSFKPMYVIIVGSLFLILGFLLIGPPSFVPMDSALWLTSIGLVFLGMGVAFCFVAGFVGCLKDSMDNGLPDNLSTYSVVAGLWASALSLGAFVGPSVGGILLDHVGFRNATYFPLAVATIMFLSLIVYVIIVMVRTNKKAGLQKSNPESSLLLGRISPLGEEDRLEVASTSGYGAIS